MEGMRIDGFFLNACTITRSTVGGMGFGLPCAAMLGAVGSLVRISSRMLGPLLPLNGTVPTRHS